MHRGTRPDLITDRGDVGFGGAGHALTEAGDRPDTQMEIVERLEIPLDRTHGQATDLAQGDDPTDQADTQPLLTHDLLPQIHRRGHPHTTQRADTLDESMGGDLDRRWRQLDDFAGAFDGVPTQGGATLGALVEGMIDRLGRLRAGSGAALSSVLAGLRWRRLRSGRWFQTRQAARTALLPTPLELLNARFETLQGCRQFGDGGGLGAH